MEQQSAISSLVETCEKLSETVVDLVERLRVAEANVKGRDETIERLMNEWPAEHKFPAGLIEKD